MRAWDEDVRDSLDTGDSVGYHALLHLSQGQICTLVKSLGTPARHTVNDKMLWLQSPSRIIVTTLAVDNGEKSQVGISINPFYDIYHKIYLF